MFKLMYEAVCHCTTPAVFSYPPLFLVVAHYILPI